MKAKPVPLAAVDVLERQAFDWLVRLQSQPDSTDTERDCAAWRNAHPTHEQAWQAVQHTYALLRQSIRRLPLDEPAVMAQALDRAAQRMDRRKTLHRLAAVLFVATPTAWVAQREFPWQRVGADYATATGVRQGVTLPDGTQLWLNTDTAARLKFDSTQRLLLLDRGEMFIASGRDAASTTHRPLRVQTRQGLFEALGTRFSVRLLEDRSPAASQLRVEQGAVRMQPRRAGAASTVVKAGQSQLMTDAGSSVTTSPPMDPHGWMDGMLVVNDMRLADFLAEVGRYRPGHLGWHDEVADLRISGTYRLDDTDRILAILPESLPVEVVLRTRYWATVRRAHRD